MASYEVSDSTIMQVFRMRASQDERVKILLESISWEAVAVEQAARIQVLEKMVEMETAEIGPTREVVAEVDDPVGADPEAP